MKKIKKMEKDFQKINTVLIGVIREAAIYLIHHDSCCKKYCLQTSAWDAVKKLEKLMPSLSEPLFSLVKTCLSKCIRAKKQMFSVNISFKEYPVAADSLTKLAKQLDQIVKSNPSIRDSISEEDLASERLFVNLTKVASQAK